MLQNKTIKYVFITSIGLLLFFWMLYAIIHQIKHQPNLQSTWYQLQHSLSSRGFVYLTTVGLLMLVNWLIEAFKWRLLLRGTEQISMIRSIQSVLTGVAVSMITPNRIGEYMGRILYLRNIHKVEGVTVTILGSFAQLIVTGVFGLSGMIYYMLMIQYSAWLVFLSVLSLIMSVMLLYLFFNLNPIVVWTNRIPYLKKIVRYIEIVKRFDFFQLIHLLVLSTLRYLIYTLQFFLLLKLFLVDASTIQLIASIWLIFWAMAIIPTIAIAEIGIRGETAVFFLLPLSTNQLGVVSSSLLLWFINLIIPALVGCLFVYKIKLYADE